MTRRQFGWTLRAQQVLHNYYRCVHLVFLSCTMNTSVHVDGTWCKSSHFVLIKLRTYQDKKERESWTILESESRIHNKCVEHALEGDTYEYAK